MRLILFDYAEEGLREALLPFTHTRPIADIRCGILTMRERWEQMLNIDNSGTLTEGYLQTLYPSGSDGNYLLVNSSIFADRELAASIASLQPGERLIYEEPGEIVEHDETLIAVRIQEPLLTYEGLAVEAEVGRRLKYTSVIKVIRKPWDIFSLNDWAIRQDYETLTSGRVTADVPDDVTVKGADIFIEAGAIIQPGAIINAATGPVYIGRNAEIMEGCIIRGPLAMCDGSTLKMGAKIYGGTTIGPGCKVGGEVSNVVFFANSNKGHDGFLGNAVIGEWCNLGADTNCSNLKNNYDEVKVWDEAARKSVNTGLTFCGLLMGDHSKCGINTMFNTGTVAGVSCNIWGGGFPEKFIPSFSWGGPEGMSTYQFHRAMDTAKRMMARRGKTLGEDERAMLQHVFETTSASRSLMMPTA